MKRINDDKITTESSIKYCSFRKTKKKTTVDTKKTWYSKIEVRKCLISKRSQLWERKNYMKTRIEKEAKMDTKNRTYEHNQKWQR